MHLTTRKIVFLAIFAFLGIYFNSASVQAAPCSSAPGGLCEGISNGSQCSTSTLTDCTAFPRCMYSGTIGGYFCKNGCVNTGQQGSCNAGSVCLCVNQVVDSLCTSNGINLDVCSDAGIGGDDAEDPVVTITSPTSNAAYTTQVSPIEIGGTASDNIIVTQVTWSNNRNSGFIGGSGTADGTANWSVDYVNLEAGANVITVTATDGRNNTGTDTITVTYNPPGSESFPDVSITEGASNYTVVISDPDALTEVAYAWGKKPSVYFIMPFANEDTVALSATEQARHDYLYANFAGDWDRITGNKFPMDFYFPPPFKVTSYSESENDWYSYVTKTKAYMTANYASILQYPAIYVFLYPEPYFEKTYINSFGTESKQLIAEVYMSMFNDTSMGEYSSPNEIISNVLQHEIAHYFSSFPNNEDVPTGTSKYFWLDHPAGFSDVQVPCDDNSPQINCDPYGTVDSPTGTEGYYEAYSILSLVRTFIHKANFGNRDPELGPLVEMEMGLRSRHDDAPFMFYRGTVSGAGDNKQFTFLGSNDYGISSKRLYDYTAEQDDYHRLYWNVSYDSTKTTLSSSTHSFDVAKSAQAGRSLIVYAADASNPGYFKVFGNNAASANKSNIVSTPIASPSGGTYPLPQSVTLSSNTSGSTIHYTTDGSTPTASSAQYSGAISVSSSTTINAIAVKSGMDDSDVMSVSYLIGTPSYSVPIYRFWSPRNRGHFFTSFASERDQIIATYSSDEWTYEGASYSSYGEYGTSLVPVYRFWSNQNKHHFYTSSEAEKDAVAANYNDDEWLLEGVAYYVHQTQQSGTIPVYRFWSNRNRVHFYTSSEAEKNNIIATFTPDQWRLEGVSWYVPESE